MRLPTLYKRTATGAVQQWTIWVESGLPDFVNPPTQIVTEYGQVGGKMQRTAVKVASGKNLGRANATNPVDQARAEAISKWKKQQDKGYTEDVAVEPPVGRPMLAHDYAKYKHKVVWPAYAQPKLDGIRCLAHNSKGGDIRLVSRMGKFIETVPHIVEQLQDVMGCLPDETILDGELYIHGERFQAITSLVKRHQADSGRLEYHVYDCIGEGDFVDRFFEPYAMVHTFASPHVKIVDYALVYDEAGLKSLHDQWVQQGYEGAMLRHGGCPYKEGYRSQHLLKFKEFLDDDFEVVGAGEGKGKFEGMAVFQLRTRDGAVFDCMPKGTDAERRAYWENRDQYVGKLMTVRFFEWSSSNPPVPRFPVGIGVRDYE